MAKPNPMGATFAERAAAARGDENFEAPAPSTAALPNSTFASRAGLSEPEAEAPVTPDGHEEEPADAPADAPSDETSDDVNDANSETQADDADDKKTVEADDAENKAVQDGDNKSGRGVFRRS